MLNIEFYKTSGFFELKNFKAGELVFDEGSVDENIYIIISGKVSVGKYTTTEKKEIKELAILGQGEFFGEACITSSGSKEALVKSIEDTNLIFINGKTGLQDFVQKYPKEGLELLSYIIDNTNKRLVLANRLITANYEIVKSIIEIENINDKGIFNLIEKIKLITGFDYILYLEVNQVMNDYIVLKYDTRETGKFLDIVIDRKKINNLREVNEVVLENYNYIQKLSIGKFDLGFMIFSKKTNFTYDDKKLLLSVSNNLTGLLRQKIILKDELNKKSIKESRINY
ncbi:cyclic nucleotide-binding domain-containing protein [Candidatus Gracilibacteria bacterium]|nr:cyclic nucleotide-binding domain-containing protein [Candidatus Gracilibacteria bacterium]